MITPDDNASYNEEEADEQYSQQEVQGDGLDVLPPSEEDKEASERENLTQADKASEASFTLDVDRGIAPGEADRT